jgi:hypothetical protein
VVERRAKDGIPTVVRQDRYNIIKKRGKNAIFASQKSCPAGIGRLSHTSMCLSPDPPKSVILGQFAAPGAGYVVDFAQLSWRTRSQTRLFTTAIDGICTPLQDSRELKHWRAYVADAPIHCDFGAPLRAARHPDHNRTSD